MRKFFFYIRDTLHAWIWMHVFNVPLPYSLPKKYREQAKEAEAYLIKIRSQKLVFTEPKQHVCHIFKPEGNSKGRIFVVHGWMSRALFMIGIINAFYRAGYTVYAIDFPAHGASKGIRVNRYEAIKIITNAQKRFGPFTAAIGHSYGGSMLLGAYCLSKHFGVQPFDKIALLAAPITVNYPVRQGARKFKLTPQAYRIFQHWLRKRHHIYAKTLKPYNMARCGKTKFIVLHGDHDEVISMQESIHFCQNNKNARLLIQTDINHSEILFTEQTNEALLDFVEQPQLEEPQVNKAQEKAKQPFFSKLKNLWGTGLFGLFSSKG